MLRNSTPERSSADRLTLLGTRQEMIGWALLILWGVLWLLQGLPAGQVASRMEATTHIDLKSHGTEAQLRQAFDSARKSTGAEATLTLLTGKEIHDRSTFVLHVVADTRAQALVSRAAMTQALEATAPEAKRPFRVEAKPSDFTSKVWNEKMRRVALATMAVLVLLGSGALMLLLLGASKQVGVRPVTLWIKLAVPFLFLLGTSTATGLTNNAERYFGGESLNQSVERLLLFSLPIVVISVVPALFILWLTRRSGHLRVRMRDR